MREESKKKARTIFAEKKTKHVHFSPKRTKPVSIFTSICEKAFQIRVRMQANDRNTNKYVTFEGFAKLCE